MATGAALLGCALAFGSGTAGAQSSGSSSTGTKVPNELRDVRYCEIIPDTTDGTTLTERIYNTLGYNNCPRKKWNALTEDTVNEEYPSPSSTLNGPRHWVIDGAQSLGPESGTEDTFTFGGIETGLKGTIAIPQGQPAIGTNVYTPATVARQTKWTYDAGKNVYELVDPDGNVYVMQSYSQQVDTKLTLKQLSKLATKLTLPAGWSYRVLKLDQDLTLTADPTATVVNDDLRNTYQLQT
jgi:hypothetical protein